MEELEYQYPPLDGVIPNSEAPVIALNNIYLTPGCVGLVRIGSDQGIQGTIELDKKYRLINYAQRGNDFYVVISSPNKTYIKEGAVIGRHNFFCK